MCEDSACTLQRARSFPQERPKFDAVLERNACFCKDHLQHTNILCGKDADILLLNLAVRTEATRLWVYQAEPQMT
jgi:hypothetical protein